MKVTTYILLLAALTLSACNTAEGLGQDIQDGGKKLEKAADTHKQNQLIGLRHAKLHYNIFHSGYLGSLFWLYWVSRNIFRSGKNSDSYISNTVSDGINKTRHKKVALNKALFSWNCLLLLQIPM